MNLQNWSFAISSDINNINVVTLNMLVSRSNSSFVFPTMMQAIPKQLDKDWLRTYAVSRFKQPRLYKEGEKFFKGIWFGLDIS